MTGPGFASYGTEDEFAAWLRRPAALSSAELAWVRDSLEVAGILIRNHIDMTGVGPLDEKFTIARRVSFQMVRPAFVRAWNRVGLSAWSETTGGITESATVMQSAAMHNPDADIQFTEGHKAMFGLGVAATAPRWHFGDDC